VVIPRAFLGEQCEGAGQTREPRMPVDGVGPTRPPAWIGSRVAHPAGDLTRSTAYYRDLLGVQPRGGFSGHDGYDGVFFGLPGGGELELTAGPVEPTAGTEEDLLVLYVRTMDEVRTIGTGLASAGVRSVDSPNPYWNRCGQTFLDPDGYRIVIAATAMSDGDPREQAVGHDGPPTIDIDWHVGSREELRPLFELAEDSRTQLDEYLYHGKVLLARRGSATVGHLQLVPTTRAGEIELKNMAVVPDQRGTGVGRALVASAVLRCGAEGWSRMVVATAAADTGNLRFYQRLGFRFRSVERDAFTAATGYPDVIVIDGIPLLDRVWLSQDLHDRRPDTSASPA
jgi:GNAT superfamily N-acetyltransferase